MSFKTTGAVQHRNWNLFLGRGVVVPPVTSLRIFGSDFTNSFYSDDLGINWTLIADLPGYGGVAFDGTSYVFVDPGSIWSSADGVSWVSRLTSSGGNLREAVYNGTTFAVADAGFFKRVVYFSDDGINWTTSSVIPAGVNILRVFWVNTGWCVLEENVGFWFTDNNGSSWTFIGATFAGVPVTNVQKLPNQGISKSIDGNFAWKQNANLGVSTIAGFATIAISTAILTDDYAQACANATALLVVQSGGTVHRTIDGSSYTAVLTGAGIRYVMWTGAQFVAFANSLTGNIYTSDDDGVTWDLYGVQTLFQDYTGGGI